MDQKEEFENIIKDADQSREKSLILLICACKSLVGLQGEFERQEFDEEQIKQIGQLLDCVDHIMDLWLGKLNEGQIKLEELIELIEESDLLNVFVHLYYRNLTERFAKIEQILHKIFTNLPIANDNQIPFYLYLMAITQKFKQDNSEEKFKLGEKLNGYLLKNLSFCLENAKVKNCVQVLADCLYDVLQNKLSDELRSPIFGLLATITYHYENLSWFIKPADERRSFLLVSRLACIESRMCLETKLNDLKLLTNSLIIVEHSIKSLIEDDSKIDKQGDDGKPTKSITDYLASDDIIQLIDAIKLLMQSIVIYLTENQCILTVGASDDKMEIVHTTNETSSVDKPNYDQFQVCLRVLCLYLTFENEFLNKDFDQIINIISKYILNELPKSDRNNSLINLSLSALVSIIDNDLNKYKEQLIKLNLIGEIESQMNKSTEKYEMNMFKSFLDSIANF